MPRKYVQNRLRSQSQSHFPDFKKKQKLELKTIQFINRKFSDLRNEFNNFNNKQKNEKLPSMLQVLHNKQFYLQKHQALAQMIFKQVKSKKQKKQAIKKHKLYLLTEESKLLQKKLAIYEQQFVQNQKQKTYWGNQLFLLKDRKNKIITQKQDLNLAQKDQQFKKRRVNSQYQRQNIFILRKWSQQKANISNSNNFKNELKTDLKIPKIDHFYKNYELYLAGKISKKHCLQNLKGQNNLIKKIGGKQNLKPKLKLRL